MTRILLVEDSIDCLTLLQIQLEWMGYEVEALAQAEDALIAARRTPPDVIVSDLGMPGMDGFEFIKHIREMPALIAIPAIALTGAARDRDIQQALAVGFTAHLAKPVEAGLLGHRIEEVTAQKALRAHF